MDDGNWNFDHLDELLSDEEVPNEVKRDIASLKEKHADMKDNLDKKRKELDETAGKLREFDEIIGKVDGWNRHVGSHPDFVEPISNNPDSLKKELKEVEVFACFPFTFCAQFHLLALLYAFILQPRSWTQCPRGAISASPLTLGEGKNFIQEAGT